MTKRLDGKIALVTGASRGIGAAVAIKYAEEGAHVIIAARTATALESVDDEIKKINGNCIIVPVDLTEYQKIDQLGALIYERFGKLDIIVSNAAQLGHLSPLHQIDSKVWEKIIALNMTANYRILRSMDPLLRMSDSGRGIFVTSAVVQNDSPYWGAYAVSKAGLEKLVKTYAAEVRQSNIRVNLVDPGQVDTKMLAEAMPGLDMSNIKKPNEITEIFVQLAESSFDKNGEIFKAQ
ncbi:MAG: SDR family NAD(P)-dependent oxidoreductase [Rickettsiales bacterium]|nr:SDR family NAD(P)-dependent oxidoreductase [Pseudomonadota bacterium]MDA0965332.1 SDR family NAD(P)-dependent oxidoreductase [Pseudomonadota bacterium]MDG4544437.1 SDR family NAD(P)-dependent oxidoreductase [Rickettsiales bacterium]MDG4546567.1 SDR family NAD(P)-dependent oxidoreductase [Rickettsiales bacterium]MDG4548761.1 SDR family NAD(P)-dependent oxidoreductase [Rickettsiales bacterium]